MYSKKGLKERSQPPPPQPLRPAKSKVFSRRKSPLTTAVICNLKGYFRQPGNRKTILKVPSFWTIVTNHRIFTTEQNFFFFFFNFFFIFNNIYSINNQQSKILTNTTILTLLTIQYLEYNRLRYLLCLQCKDLQYSVLTTLPTHYSHYNALFTSSSN